MSVIRSMQKEDLPSVAGLEEQCFTVPWPENLLSQCLDSPLDQVWVLEEEGGIAGYCNLASLRERENLCGLPYILQKGAGGTPGS